jgi:hypothetical protein
VHDLDETVKRFFLVLCGVGYAEVLSEEAFDAAYILSLVVISDLSECPAEEFGAKGTASPFDFAFNSGPMPHVSECE